MRIIRRDSLLAAPWKNGGGITRQIASYPPGSSMEDFDWRISTATVSEDGAFSIFAGVQRRLYILEGAGLELQLADGRRRLLPGEHIDFSGDDPVFGRLIDGTVTDLNIMVRRERVRAAYRHVSVAGAARVTLPCESAALFVREGQAAIAGEVIGRFDTVLFDGTSVAEIAGTAELIVIGFEQTP